VAPRRNTILLWLVTSVALCCEPLLAADFSVHDTGAKADSTTDDAAAIQRAIDQASRAGGRVLFPPAERPYLIGKPLVVAASNVELHGPGATLKLADGASAGKTVDCIEIKGTKDKPLRDIAIRGLTIDANYWKQPGAKAPRGIDSDWATNLVVDKVTIKRAWVGLTFGRGVTHSEARDCLITQWHNDAYDVSGDRDAAATHHVRFLRCRAANSPDEDQGGLPGRRDDAWEIEDGCTDVELVDCVAENAGGTAFGVRSHRYTKPVEMRRIAFTRCRATKMRRFGWCVRGTSAIVTTHGVKLIDCSSDSTCAFYNGVGDIEIAGGTFTAPLLIGMYRDSEKATQPPAAPARDVAISRAKLDVLKANLKPGNDGAQGYQPTLTLRRTTVANTLKVFGDRKHLDATDCQLPQ